MPRNQNVAIFWDFETAQVKSRASGYKVAKALRDIAHSYGVVRSFRAYLDVASQPHPEEFMDLRREMHCSGISIVDCPGISRKDVADKAMIVDMLTLAMDESPENTILLATGDTDLCYTLAVLRFRGFKTILVCPPQTDESLLMQAEETFSWNKEVLGIDDDPVASSSPPSPSPSSAPSASSTSSKHKLSLYFSYPAPPLSRDRISGSNQTRGQGPNERLPASRLSHRSTCSAHGGQKADMNNPPLKFDIVANGADTIPEASSPALSPVSSARGVSPACQIPRSTRGIGSNSTLASPVHTTPNPHSRRARSSTVSGEWFFPPAPSFPLDPPLPVTSTGDKATTSVGPSPSSSEAFSVVDRPNSMVGNNPLLTSSTAELPPPPVISSSDNPDNSRVPTPRRSSQLSTTPAQVPQVVAPPLVTDDHRSVTSNTTATVAPTPTPAKVKISVTPVVPATPSQGPSSTLNDRAAISSANRTSPPVAPTTKPAPLAAASVTKRPTQTKTSNSTAHTGIATGSPKTVPTVYQTLVYRLQHHRQKGVTWPNQSLIAEELLRMNPKVYKSAGVNKWSLFAQKAESDGIVTLTRGMISLKQEWLNAVIRLVP